MPETRFQPEEIIGKLRPADVLLDQGKKVAKVGKASGVTDVTHSRWRQEFRGQPDVLPKNVPDARQVASLRSERGVSNSPEVPDTERQDSPAEVDLTLPQRDALTAIVERSGALGGGWQTKASASTPQESRDSGRKVD